MGSIYKRGKTYWLKYYTLDPETGRARAVRESAATNKFKVRVSAHHERKDRTIVNAEIGAS